MHSALHASCTCVDIPTKLGVFSAYAEYCDLCVQRMRVRAWYCNSQQCSILLSEAVGFRLCAYVIEDRSVTLCAMPSEGKTGSLVNDL